MKIHFILEIEPKSVQHSNRTMQRGGKTLHYVDKKKKNYTRDIISLCNEHKPPYPLMGDVAVNIRFYLHRPKVLSGKKHPGGAIWCGKRPDVDNLYKGTIDALSRSGFWSDDAQIVDAHMSKVYHGMSDSPHIEVEVSTIQDPPDAPRVKIFSEDITT